MTRDALRVYLITDTDLCGPRGVGATTRAAVAGGVTAVQLRDPAATARQLCRAAAELLEVLAGTGVPLLINDRVDVAMAVGAQGVHLGQSDLPPAAARQLAGDGFIIGWSVTEPGQLRALEGLAPGTVDYLGVGPVYATATKPDAAPTAKAGPKPVAGSPVKATPEPPPKSGAKPQPEAEPAIAAHES